MVTFSVETVAVEAAVPAEEDDAPETDPRIFSFNTIEEAVDNFRQALKDIKAPSQFIDLFDSFFNKKR